MTIGERIKARRESMGLTPFELSLKARVSEQVIRSWEAGRRNPSVEKLKAVASALEVTLDSLVGQTESSCDAA